nr:MAG TPA: hypothetical protein [Caudoviricetes sp.]
MRLHYFTKVTLWIGTPPYITLFLNNKKSCLNKTALSAFII